MTKAAINTRLLSAQAEIFISRNTGPTAGRATQLWTPAGGPGMDGQVALIFQDRRQESFLCY